MGTAKRNIANIVHGSTFKEPILKSQRNLSAITVSTALFALVGISAEASAQVISLMQNASPAIQVATSLGSVPSAHPAQLSDNGGRAFAASYDSAGRLNALKSTTGRNIADMRVAYDPNGRIQTVRFDNLYQLSFRYRSDGTEEITDPLGGRIVRASTGGAFLTQTSADPSGVLVETLRRVETLFTGIQAVAGLNAVAAATATQ